MSDLASHFEPLSSDVAFKSTIPSHLLSKLTDTERHMIESLSRLEAQGVWIIQKLVDQNKAVLELDSRQGETEKWRTDIGQRVDRIERTCAGVAEQTTKLWDWKNTLSGKTGILFWVATMLVPVILKFMLDLWLKKP